MAHMVVKISSALRLAELTRRGTFGTAFWTTKQGYIIFLIRKHFQDDCPAGFQNRKFCVRNRKTPLAFLLCRLPSRQVEV